VLQATVSTGERYQFFDFQRCRAVLFVRNPQMELLKGYRFERVQGLVNLPPENCPFQIDRPALRPRRSKKHT
jgi:hypothetical protein